MPKVSFDAALLGAYMNDFYGYGSVTAPYWFVGLEEGGGHDRLDIARRLNQWSDLGRNVTEDIVKFHSALPGIVWFAPQSPVQGTWRQLIRILLTATTGQEPDAEAIASYQRTKLGRKARRSFDDTSAFLELMPLPSRSVRHWIFSETDLPELRSRKGYVAAIRATRVARLRSMIETNKPRVVVFYGARRSWPKMLSVEVERHASFDVATLNSTLLCFIAHPKSFGARNEDFVRLGRFIRAALHDSP
jgi:hypothetical protein